MTDDAAPSSSDVLDVPEPDAAPDESTPSRSRRARRLVIEWSVIVILAVVVSFLMRTYVVQTFFIPSASMEPTLQVRATASWSRS